MGTKNVRLGSSLKRLRVVVAFDWLSRPCVTDPSLAGMAALQFKMRNLASFGKAVLKSGSKSSSASASVPHPIPAGMEGQACPITGLFADTVEGPSPAAKEALAALEADPDIAEESRMLAAARQSIAVVNAQKPAEVTVPVRVVPLNVVSSAHRANADTMRLVQAVGGLRVLQRFTKSFYEKAFADPHLDKFIRSHEDPHGERFAAFIAEKMGDGTPWTDERRSRPVTHLVVGRQVREVSFDRSSAHFAAWHSPKREPHKWGQHFKPDDARVWMRLHFWAARETGMFDTEAGRSFMEYYTRFIGHFISVYDGKSPPFTRESVRWSADPQNIQRYLAAGNVMVDVIGQPIEQALAQLPREERTYTGSKVRNAAWPYELTPLA